MTPFTTIRQAARQLTLMTLMVFFSMYARVVLSPLLVFIQEDLAIGPAQATGFFLPMAIAYSVAMLGSGFLAQRIGHRRTIALSGFILGLSLIIVAAAGTVAQMYIGFLLIGSGAGLYPPSGVASLTAMVHDDIRGKAIAFHEMGPNTAFVVAPLVVAGGSLLLGWRWIPAISGTVIILIAVGFDRVSVAGRFPAEPPHLENLKAIVRQPEFWAITVLFSVAASATLGVFAILPTFLVGVEGYDVGMVNTLISISRVSGLVMVFLSGVLVDRIGVRRLIAAVLALTGVLTIGIGLLTGNAMLVVVFLQPVIITAFFPAAVSAMADLGPPALRSLAVSVIIPTVNLFSNGVFPSLMGQLAEAGMVRHGFTGLGIAMLASLVMIPLLSPKSGTYA